MEGSAETSSTAYVPSRCFFMSYASRRFPQLSTLVTSAPTVLSCSPSCASRAATSSSVGRGSTITSISYGRSSHSPPLETRVERLTVSNIPRRCKVNAAKIIQKLGGAGGGWVRAGREARSARRKGGAKPPSERLVHVPVRHRGRRCRLVLRDIGDERLGRQEQRRDRRCILQRYALDLGRIDDARLDHVHELHAVGVV